MGKITKKVLMRRPAGPDPLAGLLTVSEAADRVGCSRGAILYNVARGILPGWQVGHLVLVPEHEVEAWQAGKRGAEASEGGCQGSDGAGA